MPPNQIIRASAPTRICDNGGWTDTWFAEFGRIFHIAIEPRVHVELKTHQQSAERPQILINAKNFGDRYTPTGIAEKQWGKHPLLEATIREIGLPENVSVEIIIESAAPHGASTGTSAAACVALVGALDALTPGRMSAYEVAQAAWRVETEQLGQQSGIQDQIAAAFGGINLINMHAYPHATVEPLAVPAPILQELERRLMLVYLGQPHSSSAVHETVIRDMENIGPMAQPIEALRQTAAPSAKAVLSGDFVGLGQAMVQNTSGQRMLHSELVSPAAERVIKIGRDFGVLGYKINGAGGNGGSVTLLTDGDSQSKIRLTQAIEQETEIWKVIPIHLSQDGLKVGCVGKTT
ncbi:MAG: D-glycero-alpha-D-manno-heptose-7-phosphate kinase [Candidatus Promineifilaceae bacterium]|jgi:D-glycero-alpha-D-manno-heptose-7-phosphate kinase